MTVDEKWHRDHQFFSRMKAPIHSFILPCNLAGQPFLWPFVLSFTFIRLLLLELASILEQD
jgi:hypothetical protein